MRRAARAGLVFAALMAIASWAPRAYAQDDEGRPPYFPRTEKKVSGTVRRWTINLLGSLLIKDKRVEDIVMYIERLPGKMKFAKFELDGDPTPTPADVHDFYLDWGARTGYRLLFEARSPERTDEDDDRSIFEDHEVGYTDAFYRPGEDGGILVVQIRGDDMLWLWEDGHCPVGPVVTIWLGLPRVAPGTDAPVGPQPWTQRPDLPAIDQGRLSIRLELDRWELDSIADDLAARADPAAVGVREIEPLLGALYLAGPELMQPVRHAWYLALRANSAERDEVLRPWVEWADGLGWPVVAEGVIKENPFTLRFRAGPEGGVLLTFTKEDEVSLVVFDGGPDTQALGQVMEAVALVQTGQAEAPQ